MLELSGVTKRFGERLVADQLTLKLAAGETLALLGPSGCGKSTLLNLIAGLETPDAGRLLFHGRDLAGMPPEARHMALMFQDFALFPHLNVLGNVMFGLVERRVGREEARARALATLAALGLTDFGARAVDTLSGGEAQRVALARALVTEPGLILLDEPFSSLDAHLRHSLQSEFRSRFRTLGLSAIWVTHDRSEAFAMADRVAVLHEGRIQQCATPQDVLAAPASPWVARFVGYHNVTQQAVIPDAAFMLDDGLPLADIEEVLVLAEGVRLQLSQAGMRYVVQLSAREALRLGRRLQPGGRLGLRVDERALIRFPAAPAR